MTDPHSGGADGSAPDLADPRVRALAYPYDVADGDFLFDRGRVRPLPADFPRRGTPVLGIGSNRAPSQLRRKYAATLPETVLACEHARLADHDIVYLAAFTRYGALPAALLPMPGVTVDVHILWLDDPALNRMHETEGPHNYRYALRDDLRVTLANGRPPAAATFGLYETKPKVLTENGVPVPLAALAAQGRTARPMTQREALATVHRRLAPQLDFDAFLNTVIDDPDRRRAWTDILQAGG